MDVVSPCHCEGRSDEASQLTHAPSRRSSHDRCWKLRQGRRGAIGHADVVRVQREGDHRVVADERGQFDNAGSAIGLMDALVGGVADGVIAQQLTGVIVDRLLVGRGEAAAASAQRLDAGVGEAGLAGLGFVREPLELAVPEAAGQQDDKLAQPWLEASEFETQHEAEVGPFLRKLRAVHRGGTPNRRWRRGPLRIAS